MNGKTTVKILDIDTTGYSVIVSLMEQDTGKTVTIEFGGVDTSTDTDTDLFYDLFGFNVNLDYDDTGETGNAFDEVSLSIAAANVIDYCNDYIGKVAQVGTECINRRAIS